MAAAVGTHRARRPTERGRSSRGAARAPDRLPGGARGRVRLLHVAEPRAADIINKPLAHQTQKQVKAGNGPLGATYTVQQSARTVATQLQVVVQALERPGSGASAATNRARRACHPQLQQRDRAPLRGAAGQQAGDARDRRAVHHDDRHRADLRVDPRRCRSSCTSSTGSCCRRSAPSSRRVATPLMLAIPFLFVAGVLFGYFVVLPAAVRFFQNFNSGEFNVLVQASQYYHFAAVIAARDGARVPGAGRRSSRRRAPGSSRPSSCATTAATRSSRAARSRRSCRATRSRCCSRRCRCTCCSSERAARQDHRPPRGAPRARAKSAGVRMTRVSAMETDVQAAAPGAGRASAERPAGARRRGADAARLRGQAAASR